ncbi:hypothetical protein N2384_11790 [Bacillus paralicheniformis]|uniref:hypothetical protein n=1 Tax=Bacillus paralicheniformis TaxID=1648923 RepID=UPI0021A960E1|nr:hypothetical protein [Bacillus paralicheniformis]UWS63424.1 hypothetical protein N2384_11790 [Bacillus paralicheniformis]
MKKRNKSFRDFERKIKRLQQNAKELERQTPQQKDIFNDSFMIQNTKFSSLTEMLDKSPFSIKTPEDFNAIPDLKWDVYVRENTKFLSWSEMKIHAAKQYAIRQLGF